MSKQSRVLSGMRPTGKLHLGHYHGVLKNWLTLQEQHQCFYFVADWHALTTHYTDRNIIRENVIDLVIDWLGAGVDPEKSVLFIQSLVPEHAELHLLLSMVTPLGWLERVPSYKDQQEKLRNRDLTTYGFLGYPVLQSADILIYRANYVPVGEDQVPHVELTREIARRFNYLFAPRPAAGKALLQKLARLYPEQIRTLKAARKNYQETGDSSALSSAETMIRELTQLREIEKVILHSYLADRASQLLPEPQALLTKASKMPGLDGEKMSKSYGNTIYMRDDENRIQEKIKVMPTDPARIRRNDPGNPELCPVWDFHKIYSDEDSRRWVVEGCTSAQIGCLQCKGALISKLLEEQQQLAANTAHYVKNREEVWDIIMNGCQQARKEAVNTMEMVRDEMGTGISQRIKPSC